MLLICSNVDQVFYFSVWMEEEPKRAFLTKNIKLNNSGGVIKKSKDGLLLQSSTIANKVKAKFLNNETFMISGSYVEFAERKLFPEFKNLPIEDIEPKHRREGFEASNADKIFESTFIKQTERK